MNLFQLKGASADILGQRWPLSTGLTIGRGDQCQVRLQQDSVAGTHASLEITEGRILLRDLDSESGTFVNGERVNQQYLGQGDEVRIGASRFMVQAPGLKPERVLQPQQGSGKRSRGLLWLLLGLAAIGGAVTAKLLGYF